VGDGVGERDGAGVEGAAGAAGDGPQALVAGGADGLVVEGVPLEGPASSVLRALAPAVFAAAAASGAADAPASSVLRRWPPRSLLPPRPPRPLPR
jgi:hypothetical protein